MLRLVLICGIIFCQNAFSKHHSDSDASGDLGGKLVAALRDDINLDLSVDEDYEDLRAELLAYHTALATLANSSVAANIGRRSMKSTPCWDRGGICINHKLCTGFRSLSQVPGCRNNLEVCCFVWNKFQVRDFRDKGIDVLAMPWSMKRELGGKGIVLPHDEKDEKNITRHSLRTRNRKRKSPPLVLIIRHDKKK